MAEVTDYFDFIVVGGGLAGVCAAVAAARHGVRTALIEREAVLGGEANSVHRRPILGSDVWGHRPHGRETGLLEEIRLENAVRNPDHDWKLWEALLEEWVTREDALTLSLGTDLGRVETGEGGFITGVTATREGNELSLSASLYADCTGDGELGLKAGADPCHDNESSAGSGETPSPEARVASSSAHRLLGDVVLTEADLREGRIFEDEAAYGGWPLTPEWDWSEEIAAAHPDLWIPRMYGIPLRSLYSRNVPNLLMAGGVASTTATARYSTGVMGAGATMGQAVGTCAYLCKKHGTDPRTVAGRHIGELQQTLLKDDAYLVSRVSEDMYDLARFSRAVATNKLEPDTIPSNVINGLTRPTEDWPQLWASNPKNGFPTNVEIDFVERRVIDTVYLTFDTGLSRPLTITDDLKRREQMVNGPQPETVKDYTVLAGLTTQWNPIVEVKGNYQRRRVHHFDPIRVNRIRVVVHATNGVDHARILEIRCYKERE
jgi:hypothetical protein